MRDFRQAFRMMREVYKVANILVCDDDKDIVEAIGIYLEQEGYTVIKAYDGVEAINVLRSQPVDLLIIDIMMPKLDGIRATLKIREENPLPIIILSAKSEDADKILGLNVGADDYLTKPFMMKELLARLRALTRRSVKQPDGMLSFGDLELRIPNLMLTCITTKESVRLSDKEYRLLRCFMESRGRILTRETLAVRIWGYENEAEYNNVEVYLSFTRKKLSFIGSRTQIKAVRGVGYELKDEKCIES